MCVTCFCNYEESVILQEKGQEIRERRERRERESSVEMLCCECPVVVWSGRDRDDGRKGLEKGRNASAVGAESGRVPKTNQYLYPFNLPAFTTRIKYWFQNTLWSAFTGKASGIVLFSGIYTFILFYILLHLPEFPIPVIKPAHGLWSFWSLNVPICQWISVSIPFLHVVSGTWETLHLVP